MLCCKTLLEVEQLWNKILSSNFMSLPFLVYPLKLFPCIERVHRTRACFVVFFNSGCIYFDIAIMCIALVYTQMQCP